MSIRENNMTPSSEEKYSNLKMNKDIISVTKVDIRKYNEVIKKKKA